jgi:radical SAM protein with 4Fe4S-binding SPASM domain
MLDLSKLYFSRSGVGEPAPLARHPLSQMDGFGTLSRVEFSPVSRRKPTVVWNVTRTCNLHCLHCYSDSELRSYRGELTTAKARLMIEDLAHFGVRALVLAGGEPLMRPDLPRLISHAHEHGLWVELWTNGTLLTGLMASRLKTVGLDAVTFWLDGLGWMGDRFRGKAGAFEAAIDGLRTSLQAGLPTGVRITLTKRVYHNLEAMFDFIGRERIPRVTFDHLMYAGRGNDAQADDLTHQESRRALDLILWRARGLYRQGLNTEITTSNNLADGIYICLKLAETDPRRAAEVYRHLSTEVAEASASGIGVANVDSQGNVHPHPFWPDHTLGNVRKRPFSQIWTDLSQPLLAGLKDPLPRLKGRCTNCRWKEACGGNSRARAERVYGDPWMEDPACYLDNEEITREVPQTIEGMEADVHLEEKAA